jgi:hypothetical protein
VAVKGVEKIKENAPQIKGGSMEVVNNPKTQKAALEIQLKEISAEIESCRGMIDSHIKDVFSYRVS